MQQDLETNNFIGKGELATLHILKHLTKLQIRGLKEYPKSGLYKQVPIQWLIHSHDYKMLSEAHQKGSIDIVIILNQKQIAVRVQGPGHGKGLKGLGKVKHDKVQYDLLKKYIEVVDIQEIECKEIFKDRINETSEAEIISSFKTAGVLIPVI